MEFSQAFWLGIVTAILHGIGCFVDAMQEMDWDCCSYCTSCFADWFYWRGWNFELLAGAALRVGFLNFFSLRSEWIQYVIVFMTLSMVCVLLHLSSARTALTFILQSLSFQHAFSLILLHITFMCFIMHDWTMYLSFNILHQFAQSASSKSLLSKPAYWLLASQQKTNYAL